jgi:ATP-dependent Lon protease
MAPREMRRAWMTAFGNARLAGRGAIEMADLPGSGGKRQAMGFMQ